MKQITRFFALIGLLSCFFSHPAQGQKAKVPEEAAIKKSRQDVSSLYEVEYKQATTDALKNKLAERLLKVADETKNDLPGKYALLITARNIAGIAKNLDLGSAAIKKIDQSFVVNLHDLQTIFLEKLTESDRDKLDVADIVNHCIAMQLNMVGEDESSVRYLPKYREIALSLLVAGKQDKEILRVKEESAYAQKTAQAYLDLQTDPNNGEANQIMGLHLLRKNTAVATSNAHYFFRKSNNKTFRHVAELEEPKPNSFDEETTLAEAWLDTKNILGARRAKYWLAKATKRLPDFMGLKLELNKKRLAELNERVNKVAPTATATKNSSSFAGRGEAAKGQMVAKFGGSKRSEAAVAMALEWLAEHQNRDGSWSFDHTGGKCQGRCADKGRLATARNGATAMALLPFLGAGQTHKDGKYKKNVQAGLYFLRRNIKRSRKDGMMTGDLTESSGRMYSHGLCAITLCEAYGMTRDKVLRESAQTSLNYIVYAQDPVGGGWRYSPRQAGDTSVSVWQVTALKMGHLVGLQVPPNTLKGSSMFLDSVQTNSGATYGYTTQGAGYATTAAGLLCRTYLGWKKDEPALQRGVERLSQYGPNKTNIYFNYYATQVMRQYGGEHWEKWNKKMRDDLVNSQSQQGHLRGSWYVTGGHGSSGGRLYYTSLATMILEVYYRHPSVYKE